MPGQEFGAGNHRAFAALDPCKRDGDTCATGIDCCGGFCKIPDGTNNEFGQAVGMCSSDIPMCAKRDERCVTDGDCCAPAGNEPQNVCIAGFCAFVELKPGQSATADELVQWCKQNLAGYKVPRHIVFAELPKTSTGKIQKFKLRDMAKAV